MSSIECITPRIYSSSKWGSDQTALTLSADKVFSHIAIGPESDASIVELRPDGKKSFGERILVSVDRPYFGAIEAKGLGVYPVHEIDNVDDITDSPETDTHFRHRMQIQCYQSIPPFVSYRRPASTFHFRGAAGGEVGTGGFKFPPMPAMGRGKAFFNAKVDIGTADIDLVFSGINLPSYWFHEEERMTSRWAAPTDFGGSEAWSVPGGAVHTAALNTESGITADGDYAYQYAGRFDFYQCEVVVNSGNLTSVELLTTFEDN